MAPTEQDIIAALLKIVRESELIPEATYRVALGKLFCTFDAGGSVVYDENIKATKERIYGHQKSTR